MENISVFLEVLINIADILSDISLNIQIRKIPFIIIVTYYLYVFLTYLVFKLREDKKIIKNKIKKIQEILTCLFFCLICLWNIYINFFYNYIYYFNVGQGEMAIIKKDNTILMIDSGSITNDTSYIFESFSTKEGINKIDILIISHFHSDHINGIKQIIEKYEVKYIMYAYPYDLENEEYLTFLDYIKNSTSKQIIVKAGDKISIDNVQIDILFPDSKYINVSDKIDENENANSLVLNIKINNNNYLFLGDSTKESEKNILQNLNKLNISKINIIKIAHHGSKTSTSDSFVYSLKAKYSIISANKKIYNHPSDEVLSILNKYKIKTYITENSGGIKFVGI